MSTRFAERGLVDALAARWLPRQARAVYAPSGAAQCVFAVAKSRGIETILVHDLPCMRQLHDDLDVASRFHPTATFLRRFRASRADLVRQEAEEVLADRVLVRGVYAEGLLRSRGVCAERLVEPAGADRAPAAHRSGSAGRRTLLLGGLAVARAGTHELLAAIEGRPEVTLLVRAGEGTEPKNLLSHPRVRVATRDEHEQLAGVDVVVAPAWCETYPVEVGLAHARGIPVVATVRAAGFIPPTHVVEPGDAQGLGIAIDAACRALS